LSEISDSLQAIICGCQGLFFIIDETATPGGTSRYNHFPGGSIYWMPATGAHEVHGAIRNLWSSMGWERSFLGYPTRDELTTEGGVGRYRCGGLLRAQHPAAVQRLRQPSGRPTQSR